MNCVNGILQVVCIKNVLLQESHLKSLWPLWIKYVKKKNTENCPCGFHELCGLFSSNILLLKIPDHRNHICNILVFHEQCGHVFSNVPLQKTFHHKNYICNLLVFHEQCGQKIEQCCSICAYTLPNHLLSFHGRSPSRHKKSFSF